MADDDELFEDEEDASREDGGEGAEAPEDSVDDENSLGVSWARIKAWLTRRRGWVLIFGLAIAQALFAVIMIYLRSEARPVAEIHMRTTRDLAVEMLGHEVKFGQVYQLIPLRGGKSMTIGLDITLVLGQLPEERIEGVPRPNEAEFALFIQTIKDMEQRIRSRINYLLQKLPVESYGSVEAYKTIKSDIKEYVNDTLDGFDFGKGLRKDIGKRRVTEVLLPMFVRQMV